MSDAAARAGGADAAADDAADAHVSLSYGDVFLRACDIDLLRGPRCWLNDQLVAFGFEWLARERVTRAGAALIPGAAAFLMRHLGRPWLFFAGARGV